MMPFPLFTITLAALLSSCVGIVCYAICRRVERSWDPFGWGAVLWLLIQPIVLLFVIMIASMGPLWFAGEVLYAGGIALGGWYHRKAGGASTEWGASISLVLATCYLSIVLGFGVAFLALMSGFFMTAFEGSVEITYLVGIAVYPILAPVALWIWQSLRVRPGIDEPFLEKSRCDPSPTIERA